MARSKKFDIHNNGQSSVADEINSLLRTFDATGAPAGRLRIAEVDYSTTTSITIAQSSQDYDTGAAQNETSILDTIASGDVIKISSAHRTNRNVIFTAAGGHSSGTIPVVFEGQGDGANFELNDELTIAIFKGSGLVTSQIIGGLVVTSTSTTNVSNGSYNILEDTTTLTSVSSGIAQDSDWTLEITEAGITNQKGRVSAVIKCEKTGGAGRQYDFAIFKNGSIISDSEMTDLTLENNDTWSNIKCTAPVELSTGDLFSIRVSGNGTGDDIECTNGTIYID